MPQASDKARAQAGRAGPGARHCLPRALGRYAFRSNIERGPQVTVRQPDRRTKCPTAARRRIGEALQVGPKASHVKEISHDTVFFLSRVTSLSQGSMVCRSVFCATSLYTVPARMHIDLGHPDIGKDLTKRFHGLGDVVLGREEVEYVQDGKFAIESLIHARQALPVFVNHERTQEFHSLRVVAKAFIKREQNRHIGANDLVEQAWRHVRRQPAKAIFGPQ